MTNPLLDPTRATTAGRAHGQLASSVAGGGLVLSCQKIVEEGVRAQILIAPGLFRIDVLPLDDTWRVFARSLHTLGLQWEEAEGNVYRQDDADAEDPIRLRWRFMLPTQPPIVGRVVMLTTGDPEAGTRHFVAQVVVREADVTIPHVRS